MLLDTHVWVWALTEPERLSPAAKAALSEPSRGFHLSPISVWETLMLARKRRIDLSPTPSEWVRAALRRRTPIALPVSVAIAIRSENLDDLTTSDPADRFIVATALEHDLPLVTADAALLDFGPLETVW